MKTDTFLQADAYAEMWQEAIAYFTKTRGVEVDPYLLARHKDHRRSLSVIARPGRQIIQRLSTFLQRVRDIAPNQHYYQAEELHLTVLSLFTATEDHEQHMAHTPEYAAVVQSVLSQACPFDIKFRGVTASSGTVMVQGFPLSDGLEQVRASLRHALHEKGFGDNLDKRYRITTAHCTIMRFQSQPQNLKLLIDILTYFRDYDFGQTTIDTLQFVKNDWYLSSENTEVLAEYPLAPSSND